VNWGVRNAGNQQHWGTIRGGRPDGRHRHRQNHDRVTLAKSVKATLRDSKSLKVAFTAFEQAPTPGRADRVGAVVLSMPVTAPAATIASRV
jgi:hypothetical protein